MATPVKIEDEGRTAKVGGFRELLVGVVPSPPLDCEACVLPFRQYFTTDGDATGSEDMVVTTDAEFSIKAKQDRDIFIRTISVQISDNGAALDDFGALTALTNGVEFKFDSIDEGEVIIHEGIKTNLDFIRLGLGQPAFGAGTTAFKADISGGGADTYLPVIDLSATFGLPWGIRLRKGSTDTLTFCVLDNLTGISTFNIIGYGINVKG